MESRAEGAPCAPKARPGASQEAWPPRAASPKRTHLLHHDSLQLFARGRLQMPPNALCGRDLFLQRADSSPDNRSLTRDLCRRSASRGAQPQPAAVNIAH